MNDKLSQEDIDKLLSGENVNLISSENDAGAEVIKNLTDHESDTLGEIGNIFMGSAATTLSMLLGNKVEITTPKIKEYATIQDVFDVQEDIVTVEITYKYGLDGATIFALKTEDTAVIADLMMGGDGKIENVDIGELQLSAVGEAMNQMTGSASTTMASMLNINIDITPPIVKLQKSGGKLELENKMDKESIVAVAFELKVGELIDSEIIQLLSLSSAKDQIYKLLEAMGQEGFPEDAEYPPPPEPVASPPPAPQPPPMQQQMPPPGMTPPQPDMTGGMYQQQAASMPGMQPGQGMGTQGAHGIGQPITVQPVEFSSFDSMQNLSGELNKNLNIVMDIKLRLTVELGRTELPIKKVLELTRGSIVELDKVAGEPVELYANGKLIAKGEVVVIEDNFGLRITNIVSPNDRLQNL